jgi:hypothetical protein
MTISKRLVLKDNHPIAEKFNKLCALADELGISIVFLGQSTILQVADRERDLPPILIEDIECGEGIGEFPPGTECKLVYDNPAYLAQQEKEQAEYAARAKAEREAAAAVKEENLRKQEEQRQANEKKRELNELERLKRKYPNDSSP